VRVSCPARVDIGNRLDYPSFFLSLPAGVAKTANIAIELRTTLTYSPNKPGHISFVTDSIKEEHTGYPDPSSSRFPVLCAVLHHFGVTSGVFRIESQIPPGSGLGGSGVLTVAAIGLVKALIDGPLREQDRPTIALLAHFLENWLGFSSTGLQDQLAALHGGANLWSWGAKLKGPEPLYAQANIMPSGGFEELGRHMLLCFTGQPHPHNRAGEQFRRLQRSDLSLWERVAQLTQEFGTALKAADWGGAAHFLNAECVFREEIAPACLSSRARLLAGVARQCGVGCRYAGHGHGGCMWAVGDTNAINETRIAWCRLARGWRNGWVGVPKVAANGLIQNDPGEGDCRDQSSAP
jgi:D-glycero-alpha-D-manno-heptose-7-phosphate kinase